MDRCKIERLEGGGYTLWTPDGQYAWLGKPSQHPLGAPWMLQLSGVPPRWFKTKKASVAWFKRQCDCT